MTLHTIPITSDEQWHDMRGRVVTASQVSALFGCCPYPNYPSYYQLWAEKSGIISPDHTDNPTLRRGRWIEEAFPLAARDKYGMELVRPKAFYYDDDLRLGATPDFFEGERELWEGKSTTAWIMEKEWQGEIPLHYLLQHQTQYRVTGRTTGGILALSMGSYGTLDLERFQVEPHLPTIQRIEQAVAEFWQRVDSGDAPDPDYARDGDVLRKVYPRDNGQEIDLTWDHDFYAHLEEYDRRRAEAKQADTLMDAATAALQHRMGSYARATCGRYKVSFTSSECAAYEVKAHVKRTMRVTRKK